MYFYIFNMFPTPILVLCMLSFLPCHYSNMLIPVPYHLSSEHSSILLVLGHKLKMKRTHRESHRIGHFTVQWLISQPPLLLLPKTSVATMIYHEVFTVTSERQCPFLFSFVKGCKCQQNGTQPLRKPQHSEAGISTLSSSPPFLITALT